METPAEFAAKVRGHAIGLTEEGNCSIVAAMITARDAAVRRKALEEAAVIVDNVPETRQLTIAESNIAGWTRMLCSRAILAVKKG